MQINLDLRNLTPAHFEEAEANPSAPCRYTSPCIIGTLMSEEERQGIKEQSLDGCAIEELTDPYNDTGAMITWPTAEQRKDAVCLQRAFDFGRNWGKDAHVTYERTKAAILAKYANQGADA